VRAKTCGSDPGRRNAVIGVELGFGKPMIKRFHREFGRGVRKDAGSGGLRLQCVFDCERTAALALTSIAKRWELIYD
jgi:hypothetical protein